MQWSSRLLVVCVVSNIGPWGTLASAQTRQSAALGRWYTDELVTTGESLFEAHCAACHGDRAQGAPNWRQRDNAGRFPAPPLDGSGHAWHHPALALQEVILNGSPGGSGNMPAWKGILSRTDSAAVIAWFQSLWPDEVYRTWLDTELRSRE